MAGSTANTVAVAAATVVAPALAVLPPSGRHRFALRAARAFCEALFSTKDGPAPVERMDWIVSEVDDLIVRAGWRSGGVYKGALLAVNFIAPLFIGLPLPLWSLSLEERVRALRKMEHSALAAIVLAAKSLICIMYYEHPDVQREIGFTRGCHRPGGAS